MPVGFIEWYVISLYQRSGTRLGSERLSLLQFKVPGMDRARLAVKLPVSTHCEACGNTLSLSDLLPGKGLHNQFIAKAIDRQNMPRIFVILFELAPKFHDEIIDCPVVRVCLHAPDFL